MQQRETAETRGPETLHQAQNRELAERKARQAKPAPAVLPGAKPIDVWFISSNPLDPGDGAPIPALTYVRVKDEYRLKRLRAHARMNGGDFMEMPEGWTPKSKEPGVMNPGGGEG